MPSRYHDNAWEDLNPYDPGDTRPSCENWPTCSNRVSHFSDSVYCEACRERQRVQYETWLRSEEAKQRRRAS